MRTRPSDDDLAAFSTERWSVAVLEWPEQADEAEALGAWGAPRLLLVAPEAEPPVAWDLSSDWLRRPADSRDVMARVETLQRRAEGLEGPVRLDPDGVLWRGRRWVSLGPVETRLIGVLLQNAHRVVRRRELLDAGWPAGDPKPRALDVCVHRLRGRIKPLDLEIASIRQRGFLFTDSDAGRIAIREGTTAPASG